MSTLDLTASAHTTDFRLKRGKLPSFWPKWEAMDRGKLVTAEYNGSWAITTFPGSDSLTTQDIADANFWWRGGQSHTFTDENGLVAALSTAGYTAS